MMQRALAIGFAAAIAVVLATLAHAQNLLPPELAALDTPAALEQTRYLRVTPEVRDAPDAHYRIVSAGAYRGEGCLQLTTYDEARSGMIFHAPTGEYAAGTRLVASAYVRATESAQVSIFIWTDDGEYHPIDQLRETLTIGTDWRQISVEGVLSKPAPRASVLIRVGAGDPPQRHVLLVDEVKLEPGAEPSASEANPPAAEPDEARESIDYEAPFASAPPTIDGVLGDAAWQGALELGGFTANDREGSTPPQETRVWMAYDDTMLYAAAWCEEENLAGLTDLSQVRDRPDWADDRIEFFFGVLGIPRAPTFYLSTNSFATVTDQHIGGSAWDPDLRIASGRDARGWTIEFALPLESMGKRHIAEEVWRFNIGRHHRTSYTLSSQLARFEGSFHEPPNFVTMRFAPREEPDGLRLSCLSRGEMTPLGNWVGTNRARYRVANLGEQPVSLTFSAQSLLDGEVVERAEMTREIAPGETLVEQSYTVRGQPGEVLILRVTRGGEELFVSENSVDRIQAIRVVETVLDPLYEPLLDRTRERNPRSNGHLMWAQPIGGNEYYSALQFGYPTSYEQVRRETSAAGMHFFTHWVPRLPSIQTEWVDRFENRHNPQFERLVEEARAEGLAGPALYAPYYLIGVDEQGREGINFYLSGFLPDPINRAAFVEAAAETVRRFGDVLWAICVGDEQFARQWSNSMRWFADNPKDDNAPPFLLHADEEVREQYGFGKYGIPWGMSQNDPDFPYCRRAYRSWLLDKLGEANNALAAAVHEIDPEMLIISEDTHGGTAPSAELWPAYCTVGSLQLQHHWQHAYSYGTKMARDLSTLSEIIVVPHDCDAGFPHGDLQMDELRELYSQAFRGGATGWHFWPASLGTKEPAPPLTGSVRSGNRPAWDYLLALGELVTQMPPVAYPESADAALLIGRESTNCGSTNARRFQQLYELLGPDARGWFEFISDTGLALGQSKLSDYRVVYVADLSYADRATAEALEAYVRGGGTLVCMDPLALEHNIDGSSLADARERIFGVTVAGPRETAESIALGDASLPVNPAVERPQRIAATPGAAVLGTFEDGAPAVIDYALGDGRAIYFAWSPLNADALANEGWRNAILATYTDAGCSFGHDIWRFTFPEIEVPAPSLPPAERCLTGNHAFWHQYRMVEGREQNVDTGGSCTIEGGGERIEASFGDGRLTDRLRLLRNPELSVAPRGYRGYLSFEPEDWVQPIRGDGPATVTLDFGGAYPLTRATLWFVGSVDGVVAEVSADGEAWREAARNDVARATGFQEVVELPLTLDAPTPARFLRLTIAREGELSLVEAEVWGG